MDSMNKYIKYILAIFLIASAIITSVIALEKLTDSVTLIETPKKVLVKFSQESQFTEYVNFSHAVKDKIRESKGLWHYKYTIQIPASLDTVLISQFMDGGTISIGNVVISKLPTSNAEYKHLWYRPHLIYIPESLRTSTKPTFIEVNSSSYLKYLYILPAYAGSFQDIQHLHDVFSFVSSTLSLSSSLVALIAGLLLLLTWYINKKDDIFYYAGMSAIAWSSLFFWINTSTIPAEAAIASRLLMYSLIGISLYHLMQYLVLLTEKNTSLQYRRYFLFVILSGPIFYILTLGTAQEFVDKYWIGLVFISCIPPIYQFINHLKNSKDRMGLSLGMILIFALPTAYKDYHLIGYQQDIAIGRSMQLFDLLNAPLLTSYLVMPVLFLFSAGTLLKKYQQSLFVIRRHNIELEQALKSHELKLNILFLENLQKKEREITELTRMAIHRDLHDGIGSRLVTTTFALRTGKLTRDKLEESLLNCLKDIRLIMQSDTEQETRSLQDLLFEYLSDMEDILKETEVEITYDIPNDKDYALLGNRSTEILRIVQEILSNALKHSNARSIYLHMELSDSLLSIKIIESNFQSKQKSFFAENKPISTNTGLKSIEARARSMGAVFLYKETSSSRISLIALKLIIDRYLYLPDNLPTSKEARRVFLTSQISELTNN